AGRLKDNAPNLSSNQRTPRRAAATSSSFATPSRDIGNRHVTKLWRLPCSVLASATVANFKRSPFMRSHIYARAFCRALLEQSGECDAWHTIAAIGERLGIKSDQGFELARECARRSWV